MERRIFWIDSLKGLTILLVISWHCHLASVPGAVGPQSDLDAIISNANDILASMRMPAFFLCSGVLFSLTMGRGWYWFITSRVWFAIWISFVWTTISIAAIALGLTLYPWGEISPAQLVAEFMWSPLGVLWFVYAIAISGGVALSMRRITPVIQVAGAMFVSVVVMVWAGLRNDEWFSLDFFEMFPLGINLLLSNLFAHGIPFFILGVTLSGFLRDERNKTKLSFACAGAALAALIFVWRELGSTYAWYLPAVRVVLDTAIIMSAVWIFACSMEYVPGVSRSLAVVGRRSLDLFLVHMFFVGALFTISRHFALRWNAGTYFLAELPPVIIGSLIFSWGARRAGLSLLFSAPKIFPQRKQQVFARLP